MCVCSLDPHVHAGKRAVIHRIMCGTFWSLSLAVLKSVLIRIHVFCSQNVRQKSKYCRGLYLENNSRQIMNSETFGVLSDCCLYPVCSWHWLKSECCVWWWFDWRRVLIRLHWRGLSCIQGCSSSHLYLHRTYLQLQLQLLSSLWLLKVLAINKSIDQCSVSSLHTHRCLMAFSLRTGLCLLF